MSEAGAENMDPNPIVERLMGEAALGAVLEAVLGAVLGAALGAALEAVSTTGTADEGLPKRVSKLFR